MWRRPPRSHARSNDLVLTASLPLSCWLPLLGADAEIELIENELASTDELQEWLQRNLYHVAATRIEEVSHG